ncbi:hypothetical protein [Cellulomonas endometrii]|uniref:hypothetical protein n=1 Tax=Cellulomonas endometrii TaxID=3036301 RepID=UPI0024AE71CE|nr:hypothetical protein [Cellulomonas endometrii]
MDPAPARREPVPTARLQRALVAARLVAVAVTVLGLGSGAHVLGGGPAPSAGVVGLVAAPVLLLAAAVARRPLSRPVLLPVALAGQLGVHAALSWLGEPVAGGPVTRGASALAGHAAHASDAAGVVPAVAAPHAHPDDALMLAAHAVAVVVAVLLLVATERGVLDLARRWSAVLPALLGSAPGPVGTRSRPVLPGVPALRRLPVQHGGVGRRGPPVVLRPRATAA